MLKKHSTSYFLAKKDMMPRCPGPAAPFPFFLAPPLEAASAPPAGFLAAAPPLPADCCDFSDWLDAFAGACFGSAAFTAAAAAGGSAFSCLGRDQTPLLE